jgi:hypothetical protein
MNYNLAKQLKDAGFPQNTRYASVKNPHFTEVERTLQLMTREKGNDGYANLLSAGYDVVSLPTLGELIEACGDSLHGLSRLKNGEWSKLGWYAFGPIRDIDSFAASFEGATPEEAVAHLYLAAHPHVAP